MAPTKKKRPSEKSLAEKRNAKKLSMRRAREKLKSNPEKYEEEKKKDRERKKAQRKSIAAMSEREKRKVRKQWKVCSKKYRDKQKRNKELLSNLEENTPPNTPPSTSRLSSGKKIRRRNNCILKNEIIDLKEKNKKLQKMVSKYRKRLQRASNIKNTDVSPRKKVAKLLKGQVCSSEVKKHLIFGEVLQKQVRKNFSEEKKMKKKRDLVKMLSGRIVKKYKLISRVAHMTSYRTLKQLDKQTEKQSLIPKIKLRQDVREFLEQDEVSRQCAGKKETITRGKMKMQKRFLNDSLKNLHLKFVSCYEEHKNLSYSAFCKLRPFWILIPDCKDRETCLCQLHTNMSLVVMKLHKLGMIDERTPDEILQTITCEGELKEKCLERKCEKCKGKDITFNEYNKTDSVVFQQWIKKVAEVQIRGEMKLVKKTTKEEISDTKSKLVSIFRKLLCKFTTHVNNIKHQYSAIKQLKASLKENEALLHVDFSENYNCKFSAEIQSFHFGGSRQQVSLHTAVLYHCNKDGLLKSIPFCTLSEDCKHNSIAICAHLYPILLKVKKTVPNLETMHFLSDGPSNQYHNRNMFVLIARYLAKNLGVNSLHWHYSEAGHGKGAPDGIGGCLKRQADNIVARGCDIPDVKALIAQLKENCKGINLFHVTGAEISQLESIQPTVLPCFKGTLKVHEIRWCKKDKNVIEARRLTCKSCRSEDKCPHYLIAMINIGMTNYDSDNDSPLQVKKNDYVIVKFNQKKIIRHYIGTVIDLQEGLEVKFLRKSGKKFIFPDEEDICIIDHSDIVHILDIPSVNNRHQYTFNDDLSQFKNIC